MRESEGKGRGRVYYTLYMIVCMDSAVWITGKACIMCGRQTTAFTGNVGGSSGQGGHNDFQYRVTFLSLFPSTAVSSNDYVHTYVHTYVQWNLSTVITLGTQYYGSYRGKLYIRTYVCILRIMQVNCTLWRLQKCDHLRTQAPVYCQSVYDMMGCTYVYTIYVCIDTHSQTYLCT